MDKQAPKKTNTKDATVTKARSKSAYARRATSAIWAWIGRMTTSSSIVSLVFVLLLWALTIAVGYGAFFVLLPDLWAWASGSLLRGVAAVLGSLGLFYLPLTVAVVAYNVTDAVADAHLASDAKAVRQAKEQARESEEYALAQLEKTDTARLLPLLRYSRAQLDAYYAMGLAQVRRSFFHSIIAMWLGFMLLVLGLALYIGPVERFGIQRPDQNFNVLILISAVIIEFISVLFLWIYRSSMGQLTYYYKLQIRNHSSILCFRMAIGMDSVGDKDQAKRAIIDSMLASSLLEPERPTVEGAARLLAWLNPAAGAAAGASPPALPTRAVPPPAPATP